MAIKHGKVVIYREGLPPVKTYLGSGTPQGVATH